MPPFMQAYARDLLHKKHEEAAAAAGDAGVLRVCVLGHTRLALTTPATFAAVLRRGVFLPKPAGFYNVFMMLVGPYCCDVPPRHICLRGCARARSVVSDDPTAIHVVPGLFCYFSSLRGPNLASNLQNSVFPSCHKDIAGKAQHVIPPVDLFGRPSTTSKHRIDRGSIHGAASASDNWPRHSTPYLPSQDSCAFLCTCSHMACMRPVLMRTPPLSVAMAEGV